MFTLGKGSELLPLVMVIALYLDERERGRGYGVEGLKGVNE